MFSKLQSLEKENDKLTYEVLKYLLHLYNIKFKLDKEK